MPANRTKVVCPLGHPYSGENLSVRKSGRICKECNRNYQREYRASVRRQAHRALGSTCCDCGIADERVLQIDHIDGGGRADRAGRGYLAILRAVAAGEPGFQLLCANCHAIKTSGR